MSNANEHPQAVPVAFGYTPSDAQDMYMKANGYGIHGDGVDFMGFAEFLRFGADIEDKFQDAYRALKFDDAKPAYPHEYVVAAGLLWRIKASRMLANLLSQLPEDATPIDDVLEDWLRDVAERQNVSIPDRRYDRAGNPKEVN